MDDDGGVRFAAAGKDALLLDTFSGKEGVSTPSRFVLTMLAEVAAGSPSKVNRSIAVITDAGYDTLLLDKFTGEEGISKPFYFELNMLAEVAAGEVEKAKAKGKTLGGGATSTEESGLKDNKGVSSKPLPSDPLELARAIAKAPKGSAERARLGQSPIVLVQRETEAGGSRRRLRFRPAGGDFQGIRIYRSDLMIGRRSRPFRVIVPMSPPSYPSARLRPRRACFRFT